MSLHIYTNISEIPANIKLVNDNESFFNNRTYLKDCEFTRKVLTTIDDSEYVDTTTFRSSFGNRDIIPRNCLSTGTKTLLNLYNNPTKYCFDLCECGNNALKVLREITEGYALFKIPVISVGRMPDKSCDIVFRGKRYTNLLDFLEVAHES